MDQQPSKECEGNDDVMTYDVKLFNNYSPNKEKEKEKEKLILLNNPRDEVEGIIQR